jgi:hypothetical protein
MSRTSLRMSSNSSNDFVNQIGIPFIATTLNIIKARFIRVASICNIFPLTLCGKPVTKYAFVIQVTSPKEEKQIGPPNNSGILWSQKHVKHKARGYVYTLKYVDELKVASERSMSSFQPENNKIKDGPSTYRYMDIILRLLVHI